LESNSLTRDYFEALGIERRLQLDGAELERRRIALSRQWHPDRFAGRPEEAARATEIMSRVQDAYRTLRDPVRRAEYVLARSGEAATAAVGSEVPAELLEEVFAFNELVEDLAGGDEAARQRLQDASEEFRQMVGDCDRALEQAFSAHDEGQNGLPEIRLILSRRRYLQNLVEQAEAALAGSG
jgi:molecular chaperone HscB